MVKRFKAFIQGIFIKMGYKVVPAVDPEGFDLMSGWFKKFNFRHILDIGANEGQFAIKIRKVFPGAVVHSFEPLPHVYEKLKENFSGDRLFTAYNLAVGSEKGSSVITLNQHSASSSMLEIAEEFNQHFDFVKAERKIQINIDRLDNVFSKEALEKPYLVKVDVQGFEREVIAGGREVIRNSELVIIEVSFKELYKNQVLFDEIYEEMKNLGFTYAGNVDQLRSPVNGEILQADALFVKS